MPSSILSDNIEHFQLESLEQEKSLFLDAYPQYTQTSAIDDLRHADYPNLDRQGHIYLDFTGSGLYGISQLQAHSQLLQNQVFGNPHSANPTSENMNVLVERAREAVLEFFHADFKEYVCIFTQNASGALKLVGESYPFDAASRYLLTYDNHNSVNGIREFARAKDARFTYVPMTTPDMRINTEELRAQLQKADLDSHNLFAYPAQSNFSGVQHSLDWIAEAQKLGWDVLLDAAAYVPTNPLDLSIHHPDFVALSFYKIFGYPTGVGALIARRDSLTKLKRPWFAGGTITVASVQGDRHYLQIGAQGFEDGTLNFLNLPAIEIGLAHIQKIGYQSIHHRVESLTAWLLEKLTSMRHDNGKTLLKVFGPTQTEARGGTIVMNFFDANGQFIDHKVIERLAYDEKISLRTGCFCNPGDGELALEITQKELSTCFSMKPYLEYQDLQTCIDGKNTGAVRISVGLVSNFEDVYQFVRLAAGLINKKEDVGYIL